VAPFHELPEGGVRFHVSSPCHERVDSAALVGRRDLHEQRDPIALRVDSDHRGWRDAKDGLVQVLGRAHEGIRGAGHGAPPRAPQGRPEHPSETVPREATPLKPSAPTPLGLVERAYAAVRERLHEEGCRSLKTGKWAVAMGVDGVRHAVAGGVKAPDSCNTMCPYVCCVYCPDPVWIPSVHACVDLSFVSSRQYKNVTHARVDPQRFALAWGVALADGGHHADAWCSSLSQRHSYGSTTCSRSTSSYSTSNCAKHPQGPGD
jgi:hypothetical protein